MRIKTFVFVVFALLASTACRSADQPQALKQLSTPLAEVLPNLDFLSGGRLEAGVSYRLFRYQSSGECSGPSPACSSTTLYVILYDMNVMPVATSVVYELPTAYQVTIKRLTLVDCEGTRSVLAETQSVVPAEGGGSWTLRTQVYALRVPKE
jgi:hypothetical protein